MARYHDVVEQLRLAYDRGAADRDRRDKPGWKLAERAAFLDRLRAEGRTSLLEIGAGTGQDSAYFAGHGLDVVATDLSPGMVALCREKGVTARVMDVLSLDFPPGSFDAAYSLNCLLHVPHADLPAALTSIRRVLRPGALFFLGTYQGDGTEGILADDWHDPPRFFATRTDEQLLGPAGALFDIVDFHVVDAGYPFQSLTLRRPTARPPSGASS